MSSCQEIEFGLVVRVDVQASIATVRLNGLITAHSILYARDEVENQLVGKPAAVAVLECRSAVLGLTSAQLGQTIEGSQPGSMKLPMAVIVRPDCWQVFCEYAWYAMELGYVRAIFTDVSSASAWARKKALALALPAAVQAPPQKRRRPGRRVSASDPHPQ